MGNYINATFSCNKYYLMAELLTYSYKMESILSDGNPEFLNQINNEKREKMLNQYKRFKDIAQNMLSIKSLLNFGTDFDNVPDEEKGKFNNDMFSRLEKIAEAKTDKQLVECESKEVKEAFEMLENTDFFNSVLDLANTHKQDLQKAFEQNKNIAESKLSSILKNLSEKQMDILVLPPEIFDTQVTLNSKGDKTISVASYPHYFEKMPNLKVVAMIHEIMHTYIPINKKQHFKNKTQELVYSVINHGLVELASNCELGIPICNENTYFKLPMHNEILKKNFKDENGIKKEFYESQGINFPKEFEFESSTQYENGIGEKTITQKGELSNDKIRGIIYPYFLAYKNRESGTQIETTINEIQRDKKQIISIYGEDFYNLISNKEYLEEVENSIMGVDNILQLNDRIAQKVFGIEKQYKRQFSEQEIGKATIDVNTKIKDESRKQLEKDKNQILNEQIK